MDYEYTDITEEPNIATYQLDEEGYLVLVSGIQYDVANSGMTDKDIIGGTWWHDTAILKLIFTNEISAGDKTILDGIVADNE